ncbi:hypothetical protein LNO88_02420 [Klebsiella pneumoniae subsp. pneumoniae]|nr:hypothetical protein [Klebsiella pneumoniae subsp. pneumoniae]
MLVTALSQALTWCGGHHARQYIEIRFRQAGYDDDCIDTARGSGHVAGHCTYHHPDGADTEDSGYAVIPPYPFIENNTSSPCLLTEQGLLLLCLQINQMRNQLCD